MANEINKFWEQSTGRKLTKEQRKEAVFRYLAGETAKDLSKEFGITAGNIMKLSRRKGFLKKKGKLSVEQIEEIKIRYAIGESSAALGKEFGVTHNAVNQIIRRSGLKVRTFHESRKTLPLNHSAFSIVTPESAYWIGFLMADGCVQGNYVTLQLAEKDKDHVYKFRDFLKSKHAVMIIPPKIKNDRGVMNSTTAYRFSFSCKQIASDLSRYGVVPNKSLIAKVLNLENNRDFWRGIIDGDGSVMIKSKKLVDYPTISLCGSQEIVKQFREYVIKNTGCSDIQSYRSKYSNIVFSSATGTYAAILAKILYENSTTSLDRKQESAERVMKYVAKKNQYK